ncbi:alpha-ketoglutarate-dependent dioxygenase AlkB [Flavihumibacter rivuli]|uniref:alpha-ketoglutarate-dependent dioxygenase AlkB family protein n=1 Tax=Flavihumibacter rivuli TaxID=2838156 RepID=UPI001BDE7601|nr:alpha-ketoglutarate-dependent dioxygenase AlkB [Flavihumibacter rivuli]ULQ55231.1 alpha-ketoglutarate-dependent dioxygenase AlkB [Flavihumibacter rivuli]
MELFTSEEIIQLLPADGDVRYYGRVMDLPTADHYYDQLMKKVEWRHDEAIIFGKHIITKRKVAWYGDNEYGYTYSKITRQALLWNKELLELKKIVEERSGTRFNSCLLNLYHNGEEGMAWHSDDEIDLVKNGTIASLSLGAERRFSLRHRQAKETLSVNLQHGSLLVMAGTTQTHWLHSIPKMARVKTPRINLTFRQMIK